MGTGVLSIREGNVIDYSEVCARVAGMPSEAAVGVAVLALDPLWCGEYKRLFHPSNISEITLGNFVFLFDFTSGLVGETIHGVQVDRVVATYGRSTLPAKSRDDSRMKRYIGPSSKIFGPGYDKGHFIAHSMGGDIHDSINWFPQEKRLNRGWSEQGRAYREIEKFCARNPGTFVFSRPVYDDLSSCPSALDVGVFRAGELQIRTFDNRV